MNHIRAVACFAALLPVLASCGSSSSPPFAVSCSLRTLPSGALRASVTVTNSTSAAANVIIYGPAISWLQYIHPVLNPTQVVINLPNRRRTSYLGFVVPNVRPSNDSHLLMRFRPPPASQPLAATGSQVIQTQDLQVVDKTDCHISRKA